MIAKEDVPSPTYTIVQTYRWPECEVIIITGYPTIDTAKQALRLGANHYLVKPVSPNDVVKAARQALLFKGWTLREVGSGDSKESCEHDRWSDNLPPQFA